MDRYPSLGMVSFGLKLAAVGYVAAGLYMLSIYGVPVGAGILGAAVLAAGAFWALADALHVFMDIEANTRSISQIPSELEAIRRIIETVTKTKV